MVSKHTRHSLATICQAHIGPAPDDVYTVCDRCIRQLIRKSILASRWASRPCRPKSTRVRPEGHYAAKSGYIPRVTVMALLCISRQTSAGFQ